jgi:hypothetical protein
MLSTPLNMVILSAATGDFHFLGHVFDAAEHGDVERGDRGQAADDGETAEGLHGNVHALDFGIGNWIAMFVDGRHRLDRHRVRDYVLHHVAGGRQQGGDDEPDLGRQDFGHRLGVRDNAVHDQDAGGDQSGADIDQQRFAPPDQVDQVAQRHFQRPGYSRPESQPGEKGGRQVEIFLDEKCTDDRGQALHAGGQVNHQRWQVRPAKLAPEIDKGIVDPAPNWIIGHGFTH